ncbi:MAG: hypothetical protein JWN46_712 [Acidimicrobiales bacterium]|nr:hypothetical protein [Acidimicrobiales bacterium]
MSPVARSGSHAGRALIVATVGVLVVMGVLLLASVRLSSRNSPQVALGDQTFHAGGTGQLAASIAKRGPVLYSDVSGAKERDVILQHLGRDPAKGWYALLAAPSDKDRSCTWEWQPARRRFRARCDHARTAPADGAGLTRFKVTVTDGQLDIDLNADARSKPTSTSAPVTRSASIPG